MTVQTTAVQVETLETINGQVGVVTTLAEATTVQPNQPAKVHAAHIENVQVEFPGNIRVHGSQLESLQVENPGRIRVHGCEYEILYPLPESKTPTAVTGVTIEVLRSVQDKKRRPPMNVVAN